MGIVDQGPDRRHPRLRASTIWRAAPLAILVIAIMALTIDCGPKSPANGEWTLLTLDGSPLIAGTEITLDLGNTDFKSSDGCNTLRAGGTELIARPDGSFRLPLQIFQTEIDCVSPPGIMEQAERYLQALTTGNNCRIAEGRLEITDFEGVVTLVFTRSE